MRRRMRSKGGWAHTAWSNLAPVSFPTSLPFDSAPTPPYGSASLIFAAALCASPVALSDLGCIRCVVGALEPYSRTASRRPLACRPRCKGSSRRRRQQRGRGQGVCGIGTCLVMVCWFFFEVGVLIEVLQSKSCEAVTVDQRSMNVEVR